MYKLTSTAKNTMQNKMFILSAPQVLKNLKELGYDVNLSEMLFTTQFRATNNTYKLEASKILVSLSAPMTGEYRSVMRRDRKHFEAFIRGRYDATLARSTTSVRIPVKSAWDAIDRQVFEAIAHLIPCDIIK